MEMKEILIDGANLMQCAYRILRQVMFGEETIRMKADTFDKRLARKRERDALRGDNDEQAGWYLNKKTARLGGFFVSPAGIDRDRRTPGNDRKYAFFGAHPLAS